MYIKLSGVCIVITACSLIGIHFGKKKTLRLGQLKELKRDFRILKREIAYGQTPMSEALMQIGIRNESVFREFFQHISRELEFHRGTTLSCVWKSASEKYLRATELIDRDIVMLQELGENIGYLDKDMQVDTIELYLSNLEDEIQDVATGVKDSVRLCQVLGVLAGVFLSIIMF